MIDEELKLEINISEIFERFSRIFKIMQWEVAKKYKLSPIQVQFLIFIKEFPDKFCTVLNISKEFGLKPSTVSDAIKSLEKKGYLKKEVNQKDRRNFYIKITKEGKELEKKIKNWNQNFIEALKKVPMEEKLKVYEFLLKVLVELQEMESLPFFQTCINCKNLEIKKNNKKIEYFCKVTEKKLMAMDIKLDFCSKFKEIG